MRLSLIFELLIIFVLLAFAASRVINSKNHHNSYLKKSTHKHIKGLHKNRQSTNRYCSCSSRMCNCCREFNIPVVAVQGPGCASLQYLQGDRLAISMSFGERILSNTTVSGRKPRPICMQLPGGVSKFCGRVYNIVREGDDFKACLGLELRSLQDIEASLRVSCFRFGPRGLKVEPAQPLPVVNANSNKDDDDNDDDDDDDDDDEGDFLFGDDFNVENDVDAVDYTAFGVFDDDFVGDIFGDDGDVDDVPEEPVTIKKPATPSTNTVTKIIRNPVRKSGKPTSNTTVKKPISLATIPSIAFQQETQVSITVTPPVATTHAVMVPVITIASIKRPGPVAESSSSSVAGELVTPHSITVLNYTSSLQHQVTTPVASMIHTTMSELQQKPLLLSQSFITQETSIKASNGKNESTEPAVQYTIATTRKPVAMQFAPVANSTEESNTEIALKYPVPNKDKDEEDEEENDDDSDPISSAVEEAIEDDDSDEDTKNNDSQRITEKIPKTDINKENTKTQGVIDDIVDGMIETVTGEDDSTEVHAVKVLPADTKLDVNEDDDDDEDEDDIIARKLHRKHLIKLPLQKEMILNKP